MSQSNRTLSVLGAAAAIMLLAFGLTLTASCRGSDQIAPEGSTITLAANPATIVLVGGNGSADVVATVSSAAGLPLEDQDVRFSATAGSLLTPPPDNQPAANIPIRTDTLGNAHVVLTTNTTTTVTARSGKATGSLSLSTVNGNLNAILINQDPASGGCAEEIIACSDAICVTAQAVDNEGNGIAGVVIVFSLINASNTDGAPFQGTFTPATQATTDIGGFAHASFKLFSSDCTTCSSAHSCLGDLQAALQGGGFASTPPVHFSAAVQ